MTTVKSRVLDPVRKLEIVTLEDEFGAQMIVQHPLTLVGYNPEAAEADAIALMELNAATYKAMVNRER